MILVTAFLSYKPGSKEELVKLTDICVVETRKEIGCKSYNLFASTETDCLLILEEWESQEVLDAHMQTPHFKTFAKSIGSHLAKDIEIKTYNV